MHLLLPRCIISFQLIKIPLNYCFLTQILNISKLLFSLKESETSFKFHFKLQGSLSGIGWVEESVWGEGQLGNHYGNIVTIKKERNKHSFITSHIL